MCSACSVGNFMAPAALIAQPRTDRRQLGQPVWRLAARPTEPAQQEQTKQRIVKRPSVMSRDAHKDPSPALLARPELRTRLPFLHYARQEIQTARVTGQVPVGLVHEAERTQSRPQRMRMKLQIELTVAGAAREQGIERPRAVNSGSDLSK